MSEKLIPIISMAPLHFLPDVVAEINKNFNLTMAFNETKSDVIKKISKVEAFIVNPGAPYRIDRFLLEKAPQLRFIVTPSTGTDHIDLDYCRQNRIQVEALKSHPEVIETIHASAEFSFALLLAMIKNLPAAAHASIQGKWREIEDEFRGIELAEKKVGLIGYGRIGKKMSRYVHAMGAKIMAYDPNVPIKDPWVFQANSLEEVLTWSEIVCLHLHLTPDTRHLFNKKTFFQMRPGSYFLNTSRGGLVVEQDLVDALESGHLKGAAVDVIEGEQESDISKNKLIQYAKTHPNLIVTPHIAGLTVDSQRKAAYFAVNQLKLFFGILK